MSEEKSFGFSSYEKPKAVKPKAEEPKVEEPKAEAPKAEAPKKKKAPAKKAAKAPSLEGLTGIARIRAKRAQRG
jgi:hypothetical protein|tara:strand:- start:1158 stop:1379 length:222 start_codon:yes stop_codon:yes gene_type:complete